MKRLIVLVVFVMGGCSGVCSETLDSCRRMCAPHVVRVCTADKCECAP